MKNIARILILFLFVLTTTFLNAQTPPHPNGGKVPGSSGTTNTPVGGGAPIGSGNMLLLVLAAAYAVKKMVGSHKDAEAEPSQSS